MAMSKLRTALASALTGAGLLLAAGYGGWQMLDAAVLAASEPASADVRDVASDSINRSEPQSPRQWRRSPD